MAELSDSDSSSLSLLSNLNETTLLHIFTLNSTLWESLEQYIKNRAVDDDAFTALVATYSVLILSGSTGNGLVCLVVARKPQMRTPRNIFIINLAVSDLLLCLFTMPLTLTEILVKVWPLGEFMCKMTSTLQATSIFVSTMSITAIALDRYNAILYPTREWNKRLGAVFILTAIWLVAFLLALPMFVFRRYVYHVMNLPPVYYVAYCYEEWPVSHGRAYYSIATMIFQYVLPIVILSVAYARIYRKLLNRMSTKLRLNSSGQIRESDNRRIRRTNLLLISIAVIYVVSWLPLNIFNVITDLYYFIPERSFRVYFASCHVIGMSSACSNPLLYGWLNDNFRKEFKEVFSNCYDCLTNAIAPILSRNDASPVPLVVYTRQNSVAHNDPITSSYRNGFEDTATVVTQVSSSTTNSLLL